MTVYIYFDDCRRIDSFNWFSL